MAFDDLLITDIPAERGVSSLPDRPVMSAAELKARFDFLASACIDAHNALVTYLQSPDLVNGLYAYDKDGKAVLLGALLNSFAASLQDLSAVGAAAKIGTDDKNLHVQDYLNFIRDIQTFVGASFLGAANADGERISIQAYLDALRQGQLDIVAGQVPDGSVSYDKLDKDLKVFYDRLSAPSLPMDALQKTYLKYTLAHQYQNHTVVRDTAGTEIAIDYDSSGVLYDYFLDAYHPDVFGNTSLVSVDDICSIAGSGVYCINVDYFVEHVSAPGYCFALAYRMKNETTSVLSDWAALMKQIGVMAIPANIADDAEAPAMVSHISTGSVLLTVPESCSAVIYPALFYEAGASASLDHAVMTIERIGDVNG